VTSPQPQPNKHETQGDLEEAPSPDQPAMRAQSLRENQEDDEARREGDLREDGKLV
jgi:hypothetical protein